MIFYAGWVAYIALYFFLVAWAQVLAGALYAGSEIILVMIPFMIALLLLPVILAVTRAAIWALHRFYECWIDCDVIGRPAGRRH